MTVGEIMQEAYEQLGKPSYLDPYADDGETIDMGSSGAVSLLRWINRGYRRILNWRFPSGRIVRFRSTERDAFFSGVSLSGTATGGSDNTISLEAGSSPVADRYNGWVIEITGGTGAGQKRLVIDYSDGLVATVNKGWDVNPDATSEYRMVKAFYDFVRSGAALAADNIVLDPASEIIAVQQVIDLATNTRLVRADRVDSFSGGVESVGNAPNVFADRQGGLMFNSPVPASRAYRVRYFGMPNELSSESDVPSMPEAFHEALLLWVVWWGLRSLQEFAGAYSTKRDLEDVMASAVQQFDRGNERDNISLYMEDRYESVT